MGDLLDETKLQATLKADAVHVTVLESTTSTNDVAKTLEGLEPQIVVAECQTNGRGRFNHRFYSPAGAGIYLSLRLPLMAGQTQNLMGPIVVAVRQAVLQVTGLSLHIKWPNDLYWQGVKRGGILVDRVDSTTIVIGVGLDFNAGGIEMPATINPTMTPKLAWTRNELVAAMYQQVRRQIPPQTNWLEDYQTHCLWLGRFVSLSVAGETLHGEFQGITPAGCLILAPWRKPVLNLEPERVRGLRLMK